MNVTPTELVAIVFGVAALGVAAIATLVIVWVRKDWSRRNR